MAKKRRLPTAVATKFSFSDAAAADPQGRQWQRWPGLTSNGPVLLGSRTAGKCGGLRPLP